ncbi:MAG: DUF6339 family protein [Phyllobacteriaceae bacterium]|jgi:hypothetical protein|nr:DUF6339 family protein [Phyllobacteriaceae bacterium]
MKYLRQQIVERLYEEVPDNLARYRTGTFDALESDPMLHRELDVKAPDVADLKADQDAAHDAANATSLWFVLSHLSPADARDRRVWTMLAHTTYLDYARARYPIPEDDEAAIKQIRSHWFASSNRALERDQAISRLWWFAFMANRAGELSLEEALKALLHRTDLRANLIERPTMAQCVPLFSAWLEVLAKAQKTAQDQEHDFFRRPVYRTALKRLNALGGYRLLDSLPPQLLRELVESTLLEASAHTQP